ncbi:serine protease [Trichormus sp. NMC-1]|uniref:S1 family peptidase n=1 Tax=Trichormus sp. NMC-1 TaxID=1853259 RepID=UPI0008DC2992|nr:serine protease [Trichormus sp. NMC-1]
MKRNITIFYSLFFLFFPTLVLTIPVRSQAQIINQSCNLEPENGEFYSQKQLQTIAKQITVKVIGDNNGGSGTILAKKGNSYLVVTNSHVLLGVNLKKIKIQTPDGKPYQAQILPNTNFGKLDLAVLQFTSPAK